MNAPLKKIDVLRAAMGKGDWPAAIKLAAKFPSLGAEKAAILSGREALLRPGFQRQLGKTHQNMLVFVKGCPRKASQAIEAAA